MEVPRDEILDLGVPYSNNLGSRIGPVFEKLLKCNLELILGLECSSEGVK